MLAGMSLVEASPVGQLEADLRRLSLYNPAAESHDKPVNNLSEQDPSTPPHLLPLPCQPPTVQHEDQTWIKEIFKHLFLLDTEIDTRLGLIRKRRHAYVLTPRVPADLVEFLDANEMWFFETVQYLGTDMKLGKDKANDELREAALGTAWEALGELQGWRAELTVAVTAGPVFDSGALRVA